MPYKSISFFISKAGATVAYIHFLYIADLILATEYQWPYVMMNDMMNNNYENVAIATDNEVVVSLLLARFRFDLILTKLI